MIKFIKSNDFLRNSVVLFFGSLVTNVFNYFYHLAIGRLVPPAAYGEIESIISLMSILAVPNMMVVMIATQLGSGNKAENNASASKEILLYLSKIVLKYGVVIFGLLFFLTPFIAKHLNIDNQWALAMVWFSMLVTLFSSINLGILNGWQKFRDSSLVTAIGTAAKLCLGISLVYIGFQVSGAIASFLLSSVVMYLISFVFLKYILRAPIRSHDQPVLDKLNIKELILPFFLGNLAINLLGNVDMVLAKRNLDDIAAGEYGALNIVSKIIFFATGVIATVVFSMSSENTHRRQSSKKLVINAFILTLLMCLVASGVYFFFPKLILGLLFGSKYFAVAKYLGWFAIAVSLFSLNNLLLQVALSHKVIQPVYSSLAVAGAMILGILLLGKSIFAIIMIVIIVQALALLLTSLLLWYKS